jgi:hypothetical protein
MRHTWDTFVDEPPSVAQGGDGVEAVDGEDTMENARRLKAFTVFLVVRDSHGAIVTSSSLLDPEKPTRAAPPTG